MARAVSAQRCTRTIPGVTLDPTVVGQLGHQPALNAQTWQLPTRRVSHWRLLTGKEKAKESAPLFARIEKDFGVERSVMLGIWGIESAYGDPLVQQNHMRTVIPSLAALAWGEPRRRAYWEQELLNALVIIDRGWGTPEEMDGSWAGAMGHTQWMPEGWLNMGFDYDGDGRVSPFGKPDDALGSTARYLVERGKYRRGEHWGYEGRAAAGSGGRNASQSYAAWQKAGVTRADSQAFPHPNATARLWVPVQGGPAFLLGANFYAIRSYNPSMNYTLSIVHLGDLIMGGEPFVQKFPGSERPPTLAEVQEIQRRLTPHGYDTGGTDGRVGNDTMLAGQNFQRKIGLEAADGYAGGALLAQLRRARRSGSMGAPPRHPGRLPVSA